MENNDTTFKWIFDLWKKSKILFFILIPVVIAIFIVKVISFFNISSAKKDVKKAEETDKNIKKEQDELNDKANLLKNDADNIEHRINDETNSDLNWHEGDGDEE
jgi:hypothetical protein